jgi:hypothetical protein
MIAFLAAIYEFLVAVGPLLAAIVAAVVGIAKALFAAAEVTAVLYLFYAFLLLMFDPKGQPKIQQLITNITASGLRVFNPVFKTLATEVAAVVEGVIGDMKDSGASVAGPILTETQHIAELILSAQRSILAVGGESTPDSAIGTAAEAFKVAMGAGLGSAGFTLAFETLLPERLNTLNGVGPIMAEMAGFREVARAVLDPLYENAFSRSLRYQYQSTFKPDFPREQDAVLWHARRLLTDDQLKTIFHYSGLKGEYEDAYLQSAYHSISPFILIDLFKAGVFTDQELTHLLNFAGIRDSDQALINKYVQFIVPDPERKQALSALMTAAERGTLDSVEIDQGLQSLDVPAVAWPFVHKTVYYRRLEQLAELYRKSISEGYQFGVITDADYVPHLEAIGIAAADAQAHYAIDSIKKHGKEAAAAARAAARLATQRTRAEVNAATAAYRAGDLNLVELEAAYLAAGLDGEIATAATAMQQARRQGALRYVFGLYLPSVEAVDLGEKVRAVEAQYKRQLIDDAAAAAALDGLGIPSGNAKALLAAWAAMKSKPTTTGELLTL